MRIEHRELEIEDFLNFVTFGFTSASLGLHLSPRASFFRNRHRKFVRGANYEIFGVLKTVKGANFGSDPSGTD